MAVEIETGAAVEAAATVTLPPQERKMQAVGGVSDGTLAGSVLELAQTLTKNNAVLRERSEERARLVKITGDFRKHLAWQAQRTQQLKRNLERLHNETQVRAACREASRCSCSRLQVQATLSFMPRS